MRGVRVSETHWTWIRSVHVRTSVELPCWKFSSFSSVTP